MADNPVRSAASRPLVAVCVLALVAAAAAALFAPFVHSDHFERDWAQHLWWTQRFGDPDLFPGDRQAEFFSRPLFSPVGVAAWYRAAVPVLGAEGAARALSTLLVALSVLLLARAGHSLPVARPRLAAVAAPLLLAVGNPGLFTAAWGLPRSFSLPLHLLGVIALVEGRVVLLGATLLLAAVFYPPAAIVVGIAGAIVLLPRAIRDHGLPQRWPALLALGLAAFTVLWLAYRSDDAAAAGFGPKVTREQAESMSVFGPDGRSRFFHPDPVRFWIRSHRAGLGGEPIPAAIVGLGILLLAWKRPRWWPPAIWALLAAAFAAFLTAHALLFALHLPNRYVSVALPVVLALGVAVLLDRAISALVARRRELALPERRRRIAWVAALAVLAFFAVKGGGDLERRGRRRSDDDFRATLAAIESALPKSALVAAHPQDADTIPLRARRSALASFETTLPYYLDYYEEQRARVDASYDACYATSWAVVDALATRYGVDAFVVHANRYRPDARDVAPEPFRVRVAALTAPDRRSGFVLADPPADRILFRRGPWTVVRVGAP